MFFIYEIILIKGAKQAVYGVMLQDKIYGNDVCTGLWCYA